MVQKTQDYEKYYKNVTFILLSFYHNIFLTKCPIEKHMFLYEYYTCLPNSKWANTRDINVEYLVFVVFDAKNGHKIR